MLRVTSTQELTMIFKPRPFKQWDVIENEGSPYLMQNVPIGAIHFSVQEKQYVFEPAAPVGTCYVTLNASEMTALIEKLHDLNIQREFERS